MVFRMIHVKDSLLPMGKVWSLDFLGIHTSYIHIPYHFMNSRNYIWNLGLTSHGVASIFQGCTEICGMWFSESDFFKSQNGERLPLAFGSIFQLLNFWRTYQPPHPKSTFLSTFQHSSIYSPLIWGVFTHNHISHQQIFFSLSQWTLK